MLDRCDLFYEILLLDLFSEESVLIVNYLFKDDNKHTEFMLTPVISAVDYEYPSFFELFRRYLYYYF